MAKMGLLIASMCLFVMFGPQIEKKEKKKKERKEMKNIRRMVGILHR